MKKIMNGNNENGNASYKRRLSSFSFTKKSHPPQQKNHPAAQHVENVNSENGGNNNHDSDSHGSSTSKSNLQHLRSPMFHQRRDKGQINSKSTLVPNSLSTPKQYSSMPSDGFFKNDQDGLVSGPVTSFGTPVKFTERQSLDTINPFDKNSDNDCTNNNGNSVDVHIQNIKIDNPVTHQDSPSNGNPQSGTHEDSSVSNGYDTESDDDNSMHTVISPPIQLEVIPQRLTKVPAELFPKKQQNGSTNIHPNSVTHSNILRPNRKRSKSCSTRMVFDLPYGDGSEKIYGMENLGASCYCNSILQSLFYTKDFRNYILSMPIDLSESSISDNKHGKINQRERKLKMDGKATHNFILANRNIENSRKDNLNNANNNINDHHNTDNTTNNENESNNDIDHNNNEKQRRMSFFSNKKKDDQNNTINNSNSNTNNNNNTNSQSVSNSSNQNSANESLTKIVIPASENNGKELVVYRSNIGAVYPGLSNIKLSFEFPNKNVAVVGIVDDYASFVSDNRKKQALIDGPILNIDHSLVENETNLYNALKDIFETMVENESQIGVVSLSWLFEVLKTENSMFHRNRHQDAHEFFNYLINAIFEKIGFYYKQRKQFLQNNRNDNEEELANLQKEINFASEIFEGSLVSETKCLKCESITSRDEKFLDLSVDVLDMDSSSLNACLAQFSAKEILCEDNKFYCETCCALQEATKRMIIKQLPLNLVLHMKRFKFNESINNFTKLFHRVSYPLYMKLCNVTEDNKYKDNFYELYSVVVHLGGGPTFGHYVSLVKTETNGWLLFDDETVESIDENFVLKFFGDGPGLASAYILFYRMISPEEYLDKTLFNPTNLDIDEVTKYQFEKEMMEVHKKSYNNGASLSTNNGPHLNNSRRKSTVSKISQATSTGIEVSSDTTSVNTNSSTSNNHNNNNSNNSNNSNNVGGVFGNYSFKISDFGKRKSSIVTTNSDDSIGANLHLNNIIHHHNKNSETPSATNNAIRVDTSFTESVNENSALSSNGGSMNSSSSSNGGSSAFGWINGFGSKKNNGNTINNSSSNNMSIHNNNSMVDDAKPNRSRSMVFKKSPFANGLKTLQNNSNDENEIAVVSPNSVIGSAENKGAGSPLNVNVDSTEIVSPVSDKGNNASSVGRRRSIFGTLKKKKSIA